IPVALSGVAVRNRAGALLLKKTTAQALARMPAIQLCIELLKVPFLFASLPEKTELGQRVTSVKRKNIFINSPEETGIYQ
ncbi:MAG: hypothetical protein II967_06295, partial [Deltaproteobacteria bacterium]|nr:hypothetical protein [Deltaproteobacteria bacterium]